MSTIWSSKLLFQALTVGDLVIRAKCLVVGIVCLMASVSSLVARAPGQTTDANVKVNGVVGLVVEVAAWSLNLWHWRLSF